VYVGDARVLFAESEREVVMEKGFSQFLDLLCCGAAPAQADEPIVRLSQVFHPAQCGIVDHFGGGRSDLFHDLFERLGFGRSLCSPTRVSCLVLSPTWYKVQHIRLLYISLETDQKLSRTTLNTLHNMLHKALADAVRWGLLVRNVCDAITAPKREHFEITPLNI